ncbi:MAG: class I SAM-dependent methyltransferase [Dehalococcoidia bacterium]|nr:class I SAM-dependent methyltransferase [Dehalococcoidia bacterium]
MQTDWLEFWRELATTFQKAERAKDGRQTDEWLGRGQKFDASVKKKLSLPDPLREFVLSRVHTWSTVLDVGAGTGGWTIPLAKNARRVTAIEPSPTMSSFLDANLAAGALTNVEIIRGRWEEVEVEPHDFVVCSHAMYASPDLLDFVRKMERAAREMCFLVMRVPSHDGVLGEANLLVRGQWHDSPNFIVAYNALLSAGIHASVMIEPRLKPWTNRSLEAALGRARDHLRLGDDHRFDAEIRALLEQKLVLKDGLYYWPDGMRSALVWWKPGLSISP